MNQLSSERARHNACTERHIHTHGVFPKYFQLRVIVKDTHGAKTRQNINLICDPDDGTTTGVSTGRDMRNIIVRHKDSLARSLSHDGWALGIIVKAIFCIEKSSPCYNRAWLLFFCRSSTAHTEVERSTPRLSFLTAF
jgi:hypothetical protein